MLLTHVDVGCGLNVLSLPPFTSLAQLQRGAQEELSVEKTAAAIMAKFEPMWTVFSQNPGSLAPFMDLCLERWLYSLLVSPRYFASLWETHLFGRDQLVTLTTTTPHTAVRIVGIIHDHGLLRTTQIDLVGHQNTLTCYRMEIVLILWRVLSRRRVES